MPALRFVALRRPTVPLTSRHGIHETCTLYFQSGARPLSPQSLSHSFAKKGDAIMGTHSQFGTCLGYAPRPYLSNKTFRTIYFQTCSKTKDLIFFVFAHFCKKRGGGADIVDLLGLRDKRAADPESTCSRLLRPHRFEAHAYRRKDGNVKDSEHRLRQLLGGFKFQSHTAES